MFTRKNLCKANNCIILVNIGIEDMYVDIKCKSFNVPLIIFWFKNQNGMQKCHTFCSKLLCKIFLVNIRKYSEERKAFLGIQFVGAEFTKEWKVLTENCKRTFPSFFLSVNFGVVVNLSPSSWIWIQIAYLKFWNGIHTKIKKSRLYLFQCACILH